MWFLILDAARKHWQLSLLALALLYGANEHRRLNNANEKLQSCTEENQRRADAQQANLQTIFAQEDALRRIRESLARQQQAASEAATMRMVERDKELEEREALQSELEQLAQGNVCHNEPLPADLDKRVFSD